MLGSALTVSVVGTAAWSGAVVYKKVQEAKLHAEYVRGLSLRNDVLEELKNAESILLKNLVEAEALALYQGSIDSAPDPEALERVKFTIKEFADMMDKGAQIHPALQAPENVKNLFPDIKKLAGIQSKIPQLQNKE